MKRSPKGRLDLQWTGKDSALIPVEDGKCDYSFVDPDDPPAFEVKSIEVLEEVGAVDGPSGANEILLIVGDSGDALRSPGTIPEYAENYVGQVKLVYIDPPLNTGQTFEDLLRKRKAAENWAQAVRDEGDFGTWRHMLATETDIKQAAGSWNALLTSTKPE